LLLLLDDDVELEADCVANLVRALGRHDDIVGACADLNNHAWPMPTRAWRLYLKYVLGLKEGAWQGRVLGPLLRFGYAPAPSDDAPMEWLGTGNTLIRRSAYNRAGGFSDFFLHRSTINEDVDLGLKLSKLGRLVFCPSARLSHFHAAGGRVSTAIAAEDDLYNRYLVIRRTMGKSAVAATGLVLLYIAVETASNVVGASLRLRGNGLWSRFSGRLRALSRIVTVQFRQTFVRT
jgi:GT2 family glycosyltransferase